MQYQTGVLNLTFTFQNDTSFQKFLDSCKMIMTLKDFRHTYATFKEYLKLLVADFRTTSIDELDSK